MRGGARNEGREETDRPLSSSESSHSRGLVAAGREGGGREERGVISSRKPPLPPGVRESRRDHDKQQQQQQQQKECQQTKSVETVLLKEEAGREEVREGGRSHQLSEDTTRRYVAQMKARGHKRASSAPIPYQPPAPPPPSSSDLPLAPHIEVREATEDNRTTHVERVREREEPEVVVPYLSPVVLRKELETIISQDGGDILSREELATSSPSVYWNLVWYFSRLQLPTYLPLLTLWNFTRTHRELRKQSVQMKVDLMWDKRYPGTPDPLYLMWLGKVPRVMQLPSSPGLTRSDSATQLQSLVAKTQWGQLTSVLHSLLEDRQSTPPSDSQGTPPPAELKPRPHRSVYRETLFFKAAIMGSINVDQFDQEFRQAVQRLPRPLTALLTSDDLPPSPRARHCRTDFGSLQVT
ncbi:C-myc promoter-binding protein [Geodia barretti]|uniref:C-myc promoter-binding protein n=1 Tax=Geodia barretti TaxID=519541 RepID=A0AA35QU58_GEOBA|nr:C-myc promoter-binding protein [Geodia barretti]